MSAPSPGNSKLALLCGALLLVSSCTQSRAIHPRTQPFSLEGVERGAHLSESQAIQVAVTEARAHGANPSAYAAPKASFLDGEWQVYFGEPPGPTVALGFHFMVFVYERDNTVAFSPGR